MKPGEPISIPVRVCRLSPARLSMARAMPKSITRGPSTVTSTLDGLRSRWISPAPCTDSRAVASRLARVRTEYSGSGPKSLATTVVRSGPGTYWVATQGTRASVSASSTAAVHVPPTRRAAATSRANRLRNSGCWAYSACTTFTATVRPASERPRYTRPMPPAPRRAIRRYGPMLGGSSVINWSTEIR